MFSNLDNSKCRIVDKHSTKTSCCIPGMKKCLHLHGSQCSITNLKSYGFACMLL
uniref:Uncharacterized protein n=1 Tax=Arundo donax TaxID=35708 RepID=A0A0A8Y3X8_ARUDO